MQFLEYEDCAWMVTIPGLLGISGLLIRQYKSPKCTKTLGNVYDFEFRELGLNTSFSMLTQEMAVDYTKKLIREKISLIAQNAHTE